MIGIQPTDGAVHQVDGCGWHNASPCLLPCAAQLVHLVDRLTGCVDGFLRAGDFGRDENVQRSILIQRRNGIRSDSSVRHSRDRYFHAVLPEFHLAVCEHLIQRALLQLTQTHRYFQLHVCVFLQALIRQIVVTRDDDPRLRLGHRYALGFAVLRDVRR